MLDRVAKQPQQPEGRSTLKRWLSDNVAQQGPIITQVYCVNEPCRSSLGSLRLGVEICHTMGDLAKRVSGGPGDMA